MASWLYRAILILFRIALCASLLFGALLTFGQLAGVLALEPLWVAGSERLFFKPAMVAAASFGVLAFLGSYFAPSQAEVFVDEEE